MLKVKVQNRRIKKPRVEAKSESRLNDFLNLFDY